MTVKELFANKTFWLFMLMMICAGASEQSVGQWASAFAEQGLGINKTAGDLTGPMTFAICMGIARAIYGKYGDKIELDRFMKGFQERNPQLYVYSAHLHMDEATPHLHIDFIHYIIATGLLSGVFHQYEMKILQVNRQFFAEAFTCYRKG